MEVIEVEYENTKRGYVEQTRRNLATQVVEVGEEIKQFVQTDK